MTDFNDFNRVENARLLYIRSIKTGDLALFRFVLTYASHEISQTLKEVSLFMAASQKQVDFVKEIWLNFGHNISLLEKAKAVLEAQICSNLPVLRFMLEKIREEIGHSDPVQALPRHYVIDNLLGLLRPPAIIFSQLTPKLTLDLSQDEMLEEITKKQSYLSFSNP
jgi:hypothetical protein